MCRSRCWAHWRSPSARAAIAYEYGEILRSQGDWAAARERLTQTARLIGQMTSHPSGER